LIIFAILSFFSFSQDKIDYRLAVAGDYVSGVYVFFYCDPVYGYEFVGRVRPFDVSSEKALYRRIKRAKRKYTDFDALIFKRNFKFVEVVKFKDREGSVASMRVGDRVSYTKKDVLGKLTFREAEIVGLRNSNEVTIRYIDADGTEKHEAVNVKYLSKIKDTNPSTE